MIKNKHYLYLGIILVIYFLSRLINLNSLPVFGDEAIYVRWAQIIKSVDTLRFIPLTDGKQPLFMWLNAATLKFIADPLLAGRLISVFAGAGILTLLFLITNSFIAPLLYLFVPFAFFFDRLATADTLLSFFGLFSFYLSLKLSEKPAWDKAMLLGAVLGLAWLTKSPAVYFIVLSLFTFIIAKKDNYKKIYFPLLSVLIAFIIYNILRLGPAFSQIAQRNQDYIWSLSEILKHPLDPLVPHLHDTFTIFHYYLTLPLLLSPLLYFVFRKKLKFNFLFLDSCFWFLLPLLSNAALAKVFTGRYILFVLPYLLIILSFFLRPFFRRNYLWLLFLIFLLPFLRILHLSVSPYSVILPQTDSGYNLSWTSGWGIKDASAYLIDRARFANVIVGTEGYFGTLPDGLQIYGNQVPKLTIFGVGLDLTEIPLKLIDAKNHGDEVYLLFNQSRLKLPDSLLTDLILVRKYPKPDTDFLLLYKL